MGRRGSTAWSSKLKKLSKFKKVKAFKEMRRLASRSQTQAIFFSLLFYRKFFYQKSSKLAMWSELPK